MNDQKFEEGYLQKFNSFLSTSYFASTYKLVFLKSLLKLADYRISDTKSVIGHKWIQQNGTTLKVDLNFIAVPFTKYYWDMFYKFRLRQSQTKNQYGDDDLNIHKNFKDENGIAKKPPKTADELASDEYDSLRKKIIERSIRKEVLDHLSSSGFYKKAKGKSYIIMDSRVIRFFEKYRIILDSAINYKITKYLEGINKYFPQVAKAVLIDIPRQPLPKKEREEYDKLYTNSDLFTCFYCENEFPLNKHTRDHAIPFDYVLSENLYNSVPSCQTCNSKKSNLLPDTHIFEEIIKRNKTLTNLTDYSEKEFRKLYGNCKQSYHGNRRYFKFQYLTSQN